MPGLLFKGARRIEVDPPTLADLLHNSLDRLSSNLPDSLCLEPPLSPLTPGGKHKACRPSQSQASWILGWKEPENAECKNISSSAGSDGGQCATGDGDRDLAALVHEFIEDGSRERDQYDSDGGESAPSGSLCDSLKVLGSSKSSLEAELLAKVSAVILAINEESMVCDGDAGSDCKGACVRQLVVKHLKSQGYDAAICKLRWQLSGNVPGGDYEYVDVVFEGDGEKRPECEDHRLILDLDFQSQFEIARPTQSYRAALKLLPAVYVGSVKKLHRLLEIMSEAAKQSLTQNSMHLPPWRTIEYMFAKWLSSPHERSKVVPVAPPMNSAPAASLSLAHSVPRHSWKERRFCCTENSGSRGCHHQLRRIKESLRAAAAAEALAADNNAPASKRSSSRAAAAAAMITTRRDHHSEVLVHGFRRSASTAGCYKR